MGVARIGANLDAREHLAWGIGTASRRGQAALSHSARTDCELAADVHSVTEETMREIGHFIGGKQVAGTSGRAGDVFNPNTGEVQAKVAFAAKAEVERAIAN